jgi:oxygen-independent coproporphyrinogen-3 oxidase
VEHTADAILGFGVSAISSTPRMIWQNTTDLGAWEAAIARREFPVARGLVLDTDDRIRRDVIGRLMCDGEIDFTSLGIDEASYFARELAAVEADLAHYDPATRTLRTTPLGRLLVRNVCMAFDRYVEPRAGEPRFSSTI